MSLAGGTVEAFSSKDTNSYPGIAITELSLSGAAKDNYQLSTTSTNAGASITPKALTITGLGASDKCYDGYTTATLTGTPGLLTAEDTGTGSTTDGTPYNGDEVSAGGTVAGDLPTRMRARARP